TGSGRGNDQLTIAARSWFKRFSVNSIHHGLAKRTSKYSYTIQNFRRHFRICSTSELMNPQESSRYSSFALSACCLLSRETHFGFIFTIESRIFKASRAWVLFCLLSSSLRHKYAGPPSSTC